MDYIPTGFQLLIGASPDMKQNLYKLVAQIDNYWLQVSNPPKLEAHNNIIPTGMKTGFLVTI